MPDGKPMPTVKGVCLAVHTQHDGQWMAEAVQCLVPPPMPVPMPPS